MSKLYLDDVTFVNEETPWVVNCHCIVREYQSTYWSDLTDDEIEYFRGSDFDTFNGFLVDDDDEDQYFWRYVRGDLDFRLPFKSKTPLHTHCATHLDPSPDWEAECDESMKTFTGSMRHYARQFISKIDYRVGWHKASYAWANYGYQYEGKAENVPWVQEYPDVLRNDPLAFFHGVETVEHYKEELCKAFRLRILNFDTVKTADRINPTLAKNWNVKDGAPCPRGTILNLFGSWDNFLAEAGFDCGRANRPSVNVMDWLDHQRWHYHNVPVESVFLGDNREIFTGPPRDASKHFIALKNAGREDLAKAASAHVINEGLRAKQAKDVHALANNPTADNIVRIANYLNQKAS